MSRPWRIEYEGALYLREGHELGMCQHPLSEFIPSVNHLYIPK